MRIVWLAALIALTVLPAYAQAPPDAAAEQEKARQKELDRQYKAAVDRIPAKNVSADPWGKVRSVDEKQTKAATPPR
jgi:hypothetical protein